MNTQALSFRRLFVALCLIWLALNAPLLLGYKVLPWDAMDEFYPTVYFNAHNLRLGLAPWWNPYIYSGTPAIADPQGMLFSPLLMAWMLLRQSPSPVWFDWGVLLHLLMGGTAMLAMLRLYRANALGSLLGATVFMAGGVAASRLEHTTDVIAYAYAPVAMLALQWFIAAPTLRRGCLFGLAAGVLAVHLVQNAYLFALMLSAAVVALTWTRWTHYTRKERMQWLAGMLGAGVVAIIAALPQLLFSATFMTFSNRDVVPLEAARGASLDLRAFLIMFIPNLFHTFQGRYDAYTGPAAFVESYLYIGVVPLLSLALLVRAWKQAGNRWPLAFFAVAAVLATLYMMGTNTPFYPWLYTWLPALTHFRRPDDAAYVLNFALAVITGLCASQVNLQSRRELTILLGIAAGWFVIIALQMHDRHALPFATVLAAAIALWELRRRPGERPAAGWLLLVLVVDYRCYNLNGRFNEMHDTASDFVNSKAAQYLVEHAAGDEHGLPSRITTYNTGVVWDNSVALLGVASTQGYNPLRPALYEQWRKPRESSNLSSADNPFNMPPAYPLDRLLSVRFIVVGHRTDQPAFLPPANYVHVFGDRDVDIWRNDDAYPRILNPSKAMVLRPGEQPEPSAFSSTDFRQTMWLTPRDQTDADSAAALATTCHGVVTSTANDTPTTTTIHAHAATSGWIVLDDLDAPGWRATLDGEDTAMHRANGLFRAVCVPAGDHQLVFTFHPLLMVADVWRQQSHRLLQ